MILSTGPGALYAARPISRSQHRRHRSTYLHDIVWHISSVTELTSKPQRCLYKQQVHMQSLLFLTVLVCALGGGARRTRNYKKWNEENGRYFMFRLFLRQYRPNTFFVYNLLFEIGFLKWWSYVYRFYKLVLRFVRTHFTAKLWTHPSVNEKNPFLFCLKWSA